MSWFELCWDDRFVTCKECKKGYMYEGVKDVPSCPSCLRHERIAAGFSTACPVCKVKVTPQYADDLLIICPRCGYVGGISEDNKMTEGSTDGSKEESNKESCKT